MNLKYNHWLFKLPLLCNYDAIVIGRVALFKQSKSEVSDTLIHHEMIHQKQMDKHGVFKFYVIYFKDFLVQLVKYRNWDEAYYNIPFEVEAYEKQNDPQIEEI